MSAAIVKSAIKNRPPIVVVVGHVDHGKTTLLDTIRKTRAPKEKVHRVEEVAGSESGGITQHIGAYEVEHTSKGSAQAQKITFVDTPGHEAFSAMRLRGTNVADVALLIVAADDGVKPQTKEAIKHIKKAKIPFIVVINKIDKPGADIERTKNELASEEVLIEGRGGKVPVVEISAKEERGINDLLDIILLVAELEEFTYDAVLPAEGYVLESHRDQKRGVSTSVVLTNGTLRRGDFLVCGLAYGKVKIMENADGEGLKGAVPSTPLTIIGLDDVTVAGDPCKVVFLEEEAQEEAARHKKIISERKESFHIKLEGQEQVLSIVLKADFQGSIEAVVDSLRQIKSDRVGLKIAKCDCGVVGEADVKFAEAAGAKIFAFRVGLTKEAKHYVEQKGMEVGSYDVIYELVEAVREEMKHLLKPEIQKNEVGRMKVLAIFRTEPSRMIVGGKIGSGKIKKGAKVEVIRDDEVIGKGKIVQLQVGETKQDEVTKGKEAGIMYDGPVKIEEGDVISAYEEEKVYPSL